MKTMQTRIPATSLKALRDSSSHLRTWCPTIGAAYNCHKPLGPYWNLDSRPGQSKQNKWCSKKEALHCIVKSRMNNQLAACRLTQKSRIESGVGNRTWTHNWYLHTRELLGIVTDRPRRGVTRKSLLAKPCASTARHLISEAVMCREASALSSPIREITKWIEKHSVGPCHLSTASHCCFWVA